MRITGFVLIIVGIIVAFIGITQSFAIHSYNMAHPTAPVHKNDFWVILIGLAGAAIFLTGFAFAIVPFKKKTSHTSE